MFDETSDVFSLLSEEDQSSMKPMMPWTLMLAGDLLTKVEGFSWSAFGADGDKLLLHQRAFNYEVHAKVAVGLYSCVTPAIFGATQWLLLMQYGRVGDAAKLSDDNLLWTEKVMADPKAAGFVHSFCWSTGSLAAVYTMQGLTTHFQRHYAMLGISFDSAEERLAEVTQPDELMTSLDQSGPV